ncbi:acyl carrier protein phosphodiesterase [Pedobacter sp. UYP24]
MNFLSHYYFERNNADANMIIGVVMPDFVKNADKGINLYPAKVPHLFIEDDQQFSIYKGWGRHIKVDALFHSSDFFIYQTQQLKQLLLPMMDNTVVKPFFLAHIGLELILDHLLIINGKVDVGLFYDALADSDKVAVEKFLRSCKLENTTSFFSFLNGFISNRYLFSYQKIDNISYALNRICMRIWDNPFTETQLALLTAQLMVFAKNISSDYLSIFDEIEHQLK